MWSYSSLKEAEECPRRWMLSRADYPGIWTRHGYPPRPSAAALLGDVVHAALEAILLGFKTAGCTSARDPSTIGVLKGLGGYSKLAERAIDQRLALLAANPRAAERLDSLRTTLLLRLPDIRQRIQEIVSRVHVVPAQVHAKAPTDTQQRLPLDNGSHPEVTLQSKDLRLLGRVDLVTVSADVCEIVDYKTGAEDLQHQDQLRMYALLWNLDGDLNPARRPATRLVLAYATRDVAVDPPDADDLDRLKLEVRERIEQVEEALVVRPPVAHPSAAWCHLCSVRQLCPEYWASPELAAVQAASERFDFAGIVAAQNGPRSWMLASGREGSKLLLRTPSEAVRFDLGEQIRILDLFRTEDPESEFPMGTMTQGSEIFRLETDRA